MKALKRFLLLLVAFLALIHFGINRFKNYTKFQKNFTKNSTKNAFFTDFYEKNTFISSLKRPEVKRKNGNDFQTDFGTDCRMNSCFDLKKCRNSPKIGLKIHFYPNFGENSHKLSQSFGKILEIIKNSVYYESNPQKACLFMSTLWDTLDRDPLSRDFQKSQSSVTSAQEEPLLEGRNHVVFNLYSGSWPHYRELDFQYSSSSMTSSLNQMQIKKILKNAILVKASQSRDTYRPDFDVSLPLFARNHPLRGPPFVSHESQQNYFPTLSHAKSNSKQIEFRSSVARRRSDGTGVTSEGRKRYLLVFKGKRYTYGIGSETRNSLHYLNNNRDVLILTTCRHGKRWREMKDEKCEQDNRLYDKHDYSQLMANSTFCLVPRGRRLGSYRFLEALSVGCIPVVLSNGWVLPFQEIIDWSQCVVQSDERLLLQIPETLRSIGEHKLQTMRHKCLALYSAYFSSIERIVLTSLLIIEQRINSHLSREHFVWNLVTSQMSSLVSQSQLGIQRLEYSEQQLLLLDENYCRNDVNVLLSPTTTPTYGYTAIIHVTKAQDVLSTNLQRLVQKSLALSASLHEIIILWSVDSTLSIPHFLTKSSLNFRIFRNNSGNGLKFNTNLVTSVETKAIFQLSPNCVLSAEELEFAYGVWQSFPLRLIGFTSRDHYFNDDKHVFEYSSKWTNQYSMVLLDAAIYHKAYNQLFTNYFISNSNKVFSDWLKDSDHYCADLAFVFLISHITREGPLKLSGRKKSSSCPSAPSWMEWSEGNRCFARLQQLFGYLPLIQSQIRLDPLLYRDLVSIRRKKYRKMESIDNQY